MDWAWLVVILVVGQQQRPPTILAAKTVLPPVFAGLKQAGVWWVAPGGQGRGLRRQVKCVGVCTLDLIWDGWSVSVVFGKTGVVVTGSWLVLQFWDVWLWVLLLVAGLR